MKNYESPKIDFQELQLREEISATCWGNHGKDVTYNYDTEGLGYVSFQIAAGDCALNLTNVYYYEEIGGKAQPLNSNDAKYQELYNALVNSGGAEWNPFKGIKYFPEQPDPSWS